jgi:5-methylcytosine-specific restriction endonuclease McrA
MSKRFLTTKDLPRLKDENGRPLCRWCRAAVKPPRRYWCSSTCVDQYDIRRNGWFLRQAVRKRDKGVCAECGCRTAKLTRVLRHAAKAYASLSKKRGGASRFWRDAAEVLDLLQWSRGKSYWEADHILEVANGGETCLENMQTLCRPCHKEKTRRMHRARVAQRRIRVAADSDA